MSREMLLIKGVRRVESESLTEIARLDCVTGQRQHGGLCVIESPPADFANQLTSNCANLSRKFADKG